MGDEPLFIHGYQFIRAIGRGSDATAFEVYSVKYQKIFCAKVTELDPALLDQEGNYRDPELYSLLHLDHPNIIQLYDYFTYKTNLFIILELCQGGTLADMLNSNAFISESYMHQLISNIVEGIKICHTLNIAHRDIKPSNIFIDSYGRPKIADFGLAINCRNRLCRTPSGTYDYIAPEAMKNELYDPIKADIWSLGITFYELATRQLPTVPIQYPLSMNPLLIVLIRKMLEIDPAKRINIEDVYLSDYIQKTKSNSLKLLKSPIDQMVARSASIKRKPVSSMIYSHRLLSKKATSTRAIRGSLTPLQTFNTE